MEVAGRIFASKDAVRKECQRILHETPIHAALDGHDDNFMRALLLRHPSAETKIGAGVSAIYVRKNPIYGDNAFWLVRTDGTETDFSYRECLRPRSEAEKVRAALRYSVRDQILDFRTEIFAGREAILCPITGAVMTINDCHIDHVEPDTFERLADMFISHEGGIAAFKLRDGSDNEIGRRLSDDNLEVRWRLFHQTHARLRAISIAAHKAVTAQPS